MFNPLHIHFAKLPKNVPIQDIFKIYLTFCSFHVGTYIQPGKYDTTITDIMNAN